MLYNHLTVASGFERSVCDRSGCNLLSFGAPLEEKRQPGAATMNTTITIHKVAFFQLFVVADFMQDYLWEGFDSVSHLPPN
jgi:hypothetical protein